MSWIEEAAHLTVVLGFCGAVFNYVVVRPLNSSIKKLGEIISDLRDDIKRNNERLNRLEGEVAKIEQAVVTAHKRIDEFLNTEATSHEKLGH